MADTKLSTVVGGGSLPKLAPDLTFPTDASLTIGDPQQQAITGINAVGSLTTALSLTGKFKVQFISFQGLASENMTFKLTVDGVVIWNSTRSVTTATMNFIGDNGSFDEYLCESSFLLEVQTTADSSIDLLWQARPIL